MVGTADSILIREESLIQSVIYREAPLYTWYLMLLQGESCQYRHSEAALGTEDVCDLWKKGKCTRKICAFRHSDTSAGVRIGMHSRRPPL